MQQQIAERAKQYALSMYPDMRDEELQSYSDCRRDYAHGAREQHKIDIDKALDWIFNHYADVYDEEIHDCKYGDGWRTDFKNAMDE